MITVTDKRAGPRAPRSALHYALNSRATAAAAVLFTATAISPAAMAQSAGSGGVSCEYVIQADWGGGFVGGVRITNNTQATVDGWELSWEYDTSTINHVWNASLSGTNPYTATNAAYNSVIQPGQTVELGFIGEGPAETPVLSGDVCSGVTEGGSDDGSGNDPDDEPDQDSGGGTDGGSGDGSDGDPGKDPDDGTEDGTDGDNDNGSEDEGEAGDGSPDDGSEEGSEDSPDGDNDDSGDGTDSSGDGAGGGSDEAISACFTDTAVGLSLSSNASCSEGADLMYSWIWGDGSTGSGVSASHTYAEAGTYMVTLTVSDGEDSDEHVANVSVRASSSDNGGNVVHVDNPFAGADAYINPDYARLIDNSIAQVDSELAGKMQQLKSVPTAVWLDRTDAIYGGEENGGRLSLEEHLDEALAQQNGDTPITASIVVYNLPDRDCAALASNGTLNADENGLARYKGEYIDVIADTLANPRFQDVRIVTVIEPDSLPNLVTNLDDPDCAKVQRDGTYVDGVRYAISRLSQIPNVYIYLDIGHSGWLGWADNFSPTVQLFTDVVSGAAGGDLSVIDGFISNVANYTPTEEVYLPDPELRVGGGNPIRSAEYFEWNPLFDEQDYTRALHEAFINAGFPRDLGMLIDTSRNGWGGDERPTSAASTTAGLNDYVDGSRIDQRYHRGSWCNAAGAGLGERPRAYPAGEDGHLDAYVWIKPPGESDGTSDSDQTTPDVEGKSFDAMCSPSHTAESGYPTGAMPGAPSAGHWFHDQFRMLVENAYPPMD